MEHNRDLSPDVERFVNNVGCLVTETNQLLMLHMFIFVDTVLL